MKHSALPFLPAEILLPDFSRTDGSRWAVVACDQYTSEPAYWQDAARTVGDAPSTLRMILPEVYLDQRDARIPAIHEAMEQAQAQILHAHGEAMLYLERTQSDGRIRRGIIGALDLEAYDYRRGAESLIRATEGTVLDRIPPRVAVRRGAPLELPHVMLLIDDPMHTVIEPLAEPASSRAAAYDFDLMLGGGHVRGCFLTQKEIERTADALSALVTPKAMAERYADASLAPLLFAVGDGNHSLASAKAHYEELKASLGEEAARTHPARYALCEVVNLHDDALDFEPIYRVVFDCNVKDLLGALSTYVAALHGNAAPQRVLCVGDGEDKLLKIPSPEQQLTVGTLQSFLDAYAASHPEITVDYIHGEDSLRALAARDNAVGFLFNGMRKDELFRTVLFDGALPRKTFSMGHAADKRYYLECRRIR